jgi:hypothetical protein
VHRRRRRTPRVQSPGKRRTLAHVLDQRKLTTDEAEIEIPQSHCVVGSKRSRSVELLMEHVVFFDNSVWKLQVSSLSTRAESGDATEERLNESAHSLQRDDGQMLPIADEADFHSHSCTRAAAHQSPRSGTRRATRPPGSWLRTWPTVGRKGMVVSVFDADCGNRRQPG